eukprot:gene3949-7159_t
MTEEMVEEIKVEKMEVKKSFINPTLDFLPLPNVFVCGPAFDEELLEPELFEIYELKQIQNLRIQEKICIFKTDEDMGVNFSTSVKELIKPPLKDEDLQIPKSVSLSIKMAYYFFDCTERFLALDTRLVKKMMTELDLYVIIVLTGINAVSKRQINSLKKNIEKQLDVGIEYSIICVSDEMENPIVCPNCLTTLEDKSKNEWICQNKMCDIYSKSNKIGEPYGFDILSKRSIEIYSNIHINRWAMEVNKYHPFPARKNCHVTLYQDALTKEWSYKENEDDNSQHNAFEDMYDAILNAKEFVYIFAWSMKHDLMICGTKERPLTVIELLKQKAEEIQVVVALWGRDNRTMMPTDNFPTEKAFKGTKVLVKLIESPNNMNAYISSHHLKYMMMDEPNGNICAFLGGLDLAVGRSDTPDHTLYEDDGVTKKNPWHDVHGRVEGEIALDIVKAFSDRWDQQKPFLKLINTSKKMPVRKNGTWTTQLVRSDMNMGFLEKGIQCSFINSIRNAERFIYIENQYFCGSSFEWKLGQGWDDLAPNIVPYEILLKIKEMILLKREFKVYIVLPYRPWGDADGTGRFGLPGRTMKLHMATMEFLYKNLSEFLKELNLIDTISPREYLRFYCLGQCEKDKEKGKMTSYMIYVHSKMIIVDDEYIVFGSGNLNERSLAGDRDTEMNLAAYQNKSTNSVKEFRKSLWKEHLGSDKEWEKPWSKDTFNEVNKRVAVNTDNFNNEERLTFGHLMQLKYSVNRDGSVKDEGDLIYSKSKIIGSSDGLVPFSWLA